jgi:hypothetical protein
MGAYKVVSDWDGLDAEVGEGEAHHATEPLLSCGVPELKTDLEAVDIHLLGNEEGTGGRRHVPGIKLVLCVPMEETGLPNACVGSDWDLGWPL